MKHLNTIAFVLTLSGLSDFTVIVLPHTVNIQLHCSLYKIIFAAKSHKCLSSSAEDGTSSSRNILLQSDLVKLNSPIFLCCLSYIFLNMNKSQ